MFFDTHCHLDFSEFDDDREYVIKQAMDEDIRIIINPGIDIESSIKASEIARQFPIVYALCGIHPHNVGSINDDIFNRCMSLINEGKVIGIGETGIDLFYDTFDADTQVRIFKKHINFARENNLPLIVHQRDAQDLMMNIFDEITPPSKVVFHCFSGDEGFLDWVVERNFYVSFTGIITFKNSASIRRIAEKIQINRVFFETDAPYLTPHPFRGKRNEPRFVRIIAEEFARIKGMTISDVSEITSDNALRFFNISV